MVSLDSFEILSDDQGRMIIAIHGSNWLCCGTERKSRDLDSTFNITFMVSCHTRTESACELIL